MLQQNLESKLDFIWAFMVPSHLIVRQPASHGKFQHVYPNANKMLPRSSGVQEPGGCTQYKSGYRDVPQTWVAKSGCQVHQWVPFFFFRKCGTWMGVPVLIGTSMGHFLSLRYIDGPFFITGTSMGRKFSITGTAIVDISFSLSSSRLRKLYKMKCRWQIITVSWTNVVKRFCSHSKRLSYVD